MAWVFSGAGGAVAKVPVPRGDAAGGGIGERDV